jgi:hypothetical protein
MSSAMAQHKCPDSGFYDDAATQAMSAAFVMALQALAARQAGRDDRAETILRTRIADAVLDLAAAGVDSEMMAHGAIDRIIAASRFRTA